MHQVKMPHPQNPPPEDGTWWKQHARWFTPGRSGSRNAEYVRSGAV